MIYDHIHNMHLYKGISPALDLGLDFISNAKETLPNGVTEIGKGVKAIVSEYKTKLENENGYEAHRRYIDIQFPLVGIEKVKCRPIEFLTETKEYDRDNDYLLYSGAQSGSDLIIGNGYFLVLFPEDGHMPQLCVEEPMVIKKLTMKVPVE